MYIRTYTHTHTCTQAHTTLQSSYRRVLLLHVRTLQTVHNHTLYMLRTCAVCTAYLIHIPNESVHIIADFANLSETIKRSIVNTYILYMQRTDRQTHSQTDRHTDRHSDKQTHRQTDRHTDRQTDTLTDRQTHSQTDRQTQVHSLA